MTLLTRNGTSVQINNSRHTWTKKNVLLVCICPFLERTDEGALRMNSRIEPNQEKKNCGPSPSFFIQGKRHSNCHRSGARWRRKRVCLREYPWRGLIDSKCGLFCLPFTTDTLHLSPELRMNEPFIAGQYQAWNRGLSIRNKEKKGVSRRFLVTCTPAQIFVPINFLDQSKRNRGIIMRGLPCGINRTKEKSAENREERPGTGLDLRCDTSKRIFFCIY